MPRISTGCALVSPGRPSWPPPWTRSLFCIWIAVVLMLVSLPSIGSEKSKYYSMQSLCKNHFLQQLYRKIDGAVLWSQNERNLDCVVTFQTHSILQRFMLRFDFLQLDCNDHLYVYDGAHAVGAYKFDLSCKNTKQTLGAIFTRTNYLTLKYVTDSWGTDSNGFKLVITAVKDPKHSCTEFRCNMKEFCISNDLVCDGINHCADGSDESTNTLCQSGDNTTVLGLEMTWFLVTIVSSLLIVLVFIVAVSICMCRKSFPTRSANGHQQGANYTLDQVYGSNGTMLKSGGGGTGLPMTTLSSSDHGSMAKHPGNWPHPAGSIGFRSSTPIIQVLQYCQAN